MTTGERPGPSGDASRHPALDVVIVPSARDLGGFEVRRALPSAQRQMIGPFIFFDQMGPAAFSGGRGVDVRPHPHINLATITYLFAGEILHRDSLGTAQPIRPGAVNWMTAGRGIVHSERTPPELRPGGSPLFGIQSWVALPKQHEEVDPSFAHYGPDELPEVEDGGCRVRLIAGALFGARSPVRTLSDLHYAEATLAAGARLPVPAEHDERGVYVIDGRIELDGAEFAAGQLLVLRPGESLVVSAPAAARLMLFGGAPLDGPRHIWWNFVSSSPERIRQAGAEWREGRFPPVPDETEFIPLPDSAPQPVYYP